MEKEKRILFYFLGWFIVAVFIFLIGIINANALTITDYEVTWYYRNQSNESNLLGDLKPYNEPSITVDGEYINGYSTRFEYIFSKDMQYNISYNLFLQYSLPDDRNLRSDILSRIENNCYADSDFKVLDCSAKQISKNCGEGCDLTISVTQQVKAINSTDAIRFGVYPNSNFSLGFYNHDSNIYNYMQNINIYDNSSSAIIDQNNQILNGQDSINQNIIDSNKETQNVIKDQFNDCRDSVNLFNLSSYPFESNVAYNSSGERVWWGSSYHGILNYFPVSPNTTYTFSSNLNSKLARVVFYDSSMNIVDASNAQVSTFTTSSNTYFIRFALNVSSSPSWVQIENGSSASKYEPYGEEICQNRIDETNDKIDQTNKELGDLNNNITDDSSPDIDGLADSAGWLPPGPLDSVLNLPLSLFNSLTTNLNKSCSPVSIPLPYVDKNLTIPCINTLYDKIGVSTFITWLGVIVSGLMLYTYLLKLYKWIEDRISLNETHSVDNWGGL